MQSNTAKAGIGALLVAAAVILFIALKGGDGNGDSTTEKSPTTATNTTGAGGDGGAGGQGDSTPAIATIVVKNGKPVGGIRDLEYTVGDRVRFKVDSDVSDEVHLHGYDIGKEVEAGGSVSFDFKADIEGIFEAELESRKEQILQLTVNP